MDRAGLAALLGEQGVVLDEATLDAVDRWRRAWMHEREQADLVREEDLPPPAPLWCWPP